MSSKAHSLLEGYASLAMKPSPNLNTIN